MLNNLNPKTLRIKFEKTGLAKYISHLDLQRLFSRSLARAKINLMHSEGYNPHPKIVFASAISLGIESLCEFADIKITDSLNAGEFLEKIKDFFPQGINILEVYEPQNNFKNIDRTRFHIFLETQIKSIELENLFSGDVFAEKKPGVIINLKDFICEINISEISEKHKLLDAIIKSNAEKYLNPENIIKAIMSKYPDEIQGYSIKKIMICDKNNMVFV